MEAHEALRRHEHISGHDDHSESFGLPQQAALFVAVIAVFLALATFLGNHASNAVIVAETNAADTSARLEANTTQVTIADADATLLSVIGAHSARQKAALMNAQAHQAAIKARLAPVDRKLASEVKADQVERSHAEDRHLFFGLSEVALQIAIVLAGVAILARRHWPLAAGGGIAAVGVLLLVAGLAS